MNIAHYYTDEGKSYFDTLHYIGFYLGEMRDKGREIMSVSYNILQEGKTWHGSVIIVYQ